MIASRCLGRSRWSTGWLIFDRWGAKVFEEDNFGPADPNAGWDGTVGGKLAPAGVYVYFAEMQCPTGGVFMREGTVVLVR